MARPVSSRVVQTEERLRARLREGVYRSGDRFLSNRAIAGRYGISYQTAHRLINRLVEEGLFERRGRSGTYVAGRPREPLSYALAFHARAERKGSFGGHLAHLLREALGQVGLVEAAWDASAKAGASYAILWENPSGLRQLLRRGGSALLVNDAPPHGLAASGIDSAGVDDFMGGAMAGDLLRERLGGRASVAFLGGPAGDRRSTERERGFVAKWPDAMICRAGGWYVEDGKRIAPQLLAKRPDGIFAANDRLAEAVWRVARAAGGSVPALVGFDNAPVAEELGLTTVAIPWESLVTAIVQLAMERCAGGRSLARRILLTPLPVRRASC